MNLNQLDNAIRRLILIVAGFACIAVVGFIGAMYMTVRAHAALERSLNERVVMVVPGAVAGEYIAGLSAENLKGLGRYMAGLGTTFTTTNFRSRMDELLTYSDPQYLPELKNSIDKLEGEVAAQSQGRYLTIESQTEQLTVLGPNLFEYKASGPWIFTAAGFVLGQDRGTVVVRFGLGQPSEKNKYGLSLKRLAGVREVAEKAQK